MPHARCFTGASHAGSTGRKGTSEGVLRKAETQVHPSVCGERRPAEVECLDPTVAAAKTGLAALLDDAKSPDA